MTYCRSARAGQMVVLTYPTKILMDAQLGALRQEMQRAGRDLCIWPTPDATFRPLAINVVNYSTDLLLYLLRTVGGDALKGKRGDLLQRLFDRQDWYGKEKAIVTTPDVLHLIAEHKYASSRRLLQYLFAGALFVFDEFPHVPQPSQFSFAIAGNPLGVEWPDCDSFGDAGGTRRSAVLFADYPPASVDFAPDSVGDPGHSEDRVFNHPLEVRVASFQTSDLEEWLPRLEAVLPELPRPVAVILDSVHRLQWLKRRLRPLTQHLVWNW